MCTYSIGVGWSMVSKQPRAGDNEYLWLDSSRSKGIKWDADNQRIHINNKMSNDGTYKKHRRLPFVGKGVGATKTVTYIHDNIIGEQFGVGDELFIEVHIHDDYDSGDIIIEIDFEPLASEIGKFVRWQLNYKCYNHRELTSGDTGSSPLDSGDIALSSTQYYVHEYDFTIPEADFSEKDYINLKLSRIASTGDAPTTRPGVISIEMEYSAKQNPIR